MAGESSAKAPKNKAKPQDKTGDSAPKRKTAKQQLIADTYIDRYTDQSSPTYLQGYKSIQSIKPYLSDKAATVASARLVGDDSIRESIRQHLSEAGLGERDRVTIVRDVATGKAMQVSEIERDGVVVQRTRTSPSPLAQLKAVDIANKMSGMYEQRRVESVLATDEYRRLRRTLMQGLSVEGDNQGGEGLGGVPDSLLGSSSQNAQEFSTQNNGSAGVDIPSLNNSSFDKDGRPVEPSISESGDIL